jgi:hypothetical protein
MKGPQELSSNYFIACLSLDIRTLNERRRRRRKKYSSRDRVPRKLDPKTVVIASLSLNIPKSSYDHGSSFRLDLYLA